MHHSINRYCFIIIISIDYCNSWSFSFSSNEKKPYTEYDSRTNGIKSSYDSLDSQSRSIDLEETVDIHESSYTSVKPPVNYDSSIIPLTKDTWVDFTIHVISLASPYMPDSIKSMNIDWKHAKNILRIFESSMTDSYDTFTRVSRELFPVAAPMMFSITRNLLEAALDIMDSANSPHSVVRRSALEREVVVGKVMKAFESLIYFTTGYDVLKYRDFEDF